MRTPLIIILIFTCCIAQSQQKPKFRIVLEATGTATKFDDMTFVDTGFTSFLDASGVRYKRQIRQETLRVKSGLKPGVTAGIMVDYPLKKSIKVNAGVLLNVYAVSTVLNSSVKIEDSIWAALPPGETAFNGINFGSPVSTLTTTIFAIDIPLGISLNPGESKWEFQADVIPSFTLTAKSKYGSDRKFRDKRVRTTSMAAGLGIEYRVAENWQVGLRYRHGFGGVYKKPSAEIGARSFGLRLTYSL